MPQNVFLKPPRAKNEAIYSYAPGTPERFRLKQAIAEARSKVVDIPMCINGEDISTGKLVEIHPPHDHAHLLGHYHKGDGTHIQMAIDSALAARDSWACMPWQQRASVFLKAATLITGPYRAKLNAATMLGQSKTAHQAEIDSACEMADFLRFNVQYMYDIYTNQPFSTCESWNRLEHRPLEGFIFALTPFNFTAIAGNLPSAPAMMGNTVIWKASNAQIYSAKVLMDIFREAGLPPGVINLLYVSGQTAGDIVFKNKNFAGIHFTGSTQVFSHIWREIADNLLPYKSYPRIIGETGGKNFVIVHKTANVDEVVAALVRGGYEYQGQKCSAASRIYIPNCLWDDISTKFVAEVKTIKVGPIEDFTNFMGAVIDEGAFDKITGFIDRAKNSSEAKIIVGGGYDKSKGYFIEPTAILAENPMYETMVEEIFGPVVTFYVYDENKYEETLELIDNTSGYGLTGAVFARDRYAIEKAAVRLVNAAGNFYINDKPTGAVVNQQPFGGARGSGTNDKAGSILNLMRWVSPRTIKENFTPPSDYR